jgi:hypothetical protein
MIRLSPDHSCCGLVQATDSARFLQDNTESSKDWLRKNQPKIALRALKAGSRKPVIRRQDGINFLGDQPDSAKPIGSSRGGRCD